MKTTGQLEVHFRSGQTISNEAFGIAVNNWQLQYQQQGRTFYEGAEYGRDSDNAVHNLLFKFTAFLEIDQYELLVAAMCSLRRHIIAYFKLRNPKCKMTLLDKETEEEDTL